MVCDSDLNQLGATAQIVRQSYLDSGSQVKLPRIRRIHA